MARRRGKNLAPPVILGILIALALMTMMQEDVPSKQTVSQVRPKAAATEEDSQPAPQPQAVQVSGTHVYVDPTTGTLMPPTPAQRKSLAQALRKQFTSDPHEPAYFVDGTISFIVGAERLNFSLVHLNKDGLLEMSCVSGLEQAVNLLESDFPGRRQHELRAEE